MYWNVRRNLMFAINGQINRNMRCFEIHRPDTGLLASHRLIETWDVLKWSEISLLLFKIIVINRNMRCIEINTPCINIPGSRPINRNMRCIEIAVACCYAIDRLPINRNMRCIEMVALYPFRMLFLQINRNMRCIEMLFQKALFWRCSD